MADLVPQDTQEPQVNEELEDNVYPTETTFYQPSEPKDQVKDKEDESAEVSASKRLTEEIIERYNEKIDFYRSIDSIPTTIINTPAEFQKCVEVNKMIVDILQSELEWLIEKTK